MKYTLHHIALSVDRLDWYLDFFTTVFEMTVQKTAGDAPERKIWFHEGVQLNEAAKKPAAGTLYDHLAISAKEKETVIAARRNSAAAGLRRTGSACRMG